ncbi:MAG: hypothetical protein EON93_03225 [Burkholderiales bacterium]|nr:MAG: hypothetical protein EON93_03225 [Burkholderiales bacterium]
MSLRTKSFYAGGALLLSLAGALPAQAQTTDVNVDLLQLLVDEGVIPFEKAQELLGKARENERVRREAEEAERNADTINVPYVPESLRAQIKEEVRKEIVTTAKTERWVAPNALPEWVEGIKISGDFRARYQNEDVPTSRLAPDGTLLEGNFPFFPDVAAINKAGGVTDAAGFPLLNSTVDRQRSNYRARLAFSAEVNDMVTVGLRLASGDDASPVSTNSTLGEAFYKDAIWIDRAFVDVEPIKGVNITAGRMPNPFYSTDMIWDADINPEGLAISGKHNFTDSIGVFGTIAGGPLQERELFDDTYLLGMQLGATARFGDMVRIKGAVSKYQFDGVQSEKNAPDGSRLKDWTAPKYLSKGNSVFNMRTDGQTTLAGLASKFDLLAYTAEIAFVAGEQQYKLTGEVVTNEAMNAQTIAFLRGEPGVEAGDMGWQVRFDAGHPTVSEFGQWRFGAAYKYVETDAVLDIFADSDFGLGGTDIEGYIVEGEVGIARNTTMGLTWLSSDSINRPPFALDIVQLNLNVRF